MNFKNLCTKINLKILKMFLGNTESCHVLTPPEMFRAALAKARSWGIETWVAKT